jgi:hypothetical protein
MAGLLPVLLLMASAHVDPATTAFPWMNGPARDSRYELAAPANRNKIHVIEAYSVSCSWCNRNAVQVDALADEYVMDLRVQVLDMGLDTADRDYQRWIQAHAANHPVVKDEDHLVFQALKQEEGIPQTFVLDCTGNLVGATAGYWGEDEKAAIRSAITAAEAVSCE